MGISKYLEKQLEQSKLMKEAQSKKTLKSVIIFAIVAIVGYIGISSASPEAAPTAVLFSGIFAILGLIFFIRYLKLHNPISESVCQLCEQEIRQNLNADESIETFDEDILNPAFGVHAYLGGTVAVGKKFVLFNRLNLTGPKFEIFRGDVLGDIKVYYSANAGVSQDIGIDLKDKNGNFIRSVLFQDKDSLYKLLEALEKIKNYSDRDNSSIVESKEGPEDSLVYETKTKISNIDRSSKTKLTVVGLVFGAFLTIAGSSSGVAFIYGGIFLFTISLISLIYINLCKRNQAKGL